MLAHTLADFGVETTFVAPEDLNNFSEAVRENTKAIFVETLGNPNSNLINLDALAGLPTGMGYLWLWTILLRRLYLFSTD